MTIAHVPSWEDLVEVVTSAQSRLWLCSPYVKDRALGKVTDALASADNALTVRVWTRMSPSDWAAGASDYESLYSFLVLMAEAGHKLDFSVSQRLHAKLFAADESLALLTSANLSTGGFERSLELSARLRDTDAFDAMHALETAVGPSLRSIEIAALKTWIDKHLAAVNKARARLDKEGDELAEAQADLDRLLGFGASKRTNVEPTAADLNAFAEWLTQQTGLPGAEVIFERYHNTGGQNLTGHVRQCFAGWMRFLGAESRFVEPLSTELGNMKPNEIFDMDLPELSDAWAEYLDDHATDSNDFYSHPVLRGILPPSLAGTRHGGGGGISTFKRMGPLVARYITEKGM